MKKQLSVLGGLMVFLLIFSPEAINTTAYAEEESNPNEEEVIPDDVYEGVEKWFPEGNKWYYLNSEGNKITGWKEVSNRWYYLDQTSGVMQTGWTKIGVTWYYLNNSGAMQVGWVKVGTKWYYLNSNGAMQAGWAKVGAEWYYLNSSGAMQTGWAKVGAKWYYLNGSGAMHTGWTKVGTTWYYLDSSGAMLIGWAKVGPTWYYLNNSGAMQTGLVTISGKKYILDKSGAWLPSALTTMPTSDLLLPGRNSGERTTPITNVVLHFTSNAAAKPKNPYVVQDMYKIFVDYGVSAHYMIGRKGEIYFLVPENRVAYHAGKGSLLNFPQYKDRLNDYSIGIEMMAIGTKKEMSSMMSGTVYNQIPSSQIGYTEAQYKALRSLLSDIGQRNPAIIKDRKHIVGHDEYAPGRKTDPGSLFNWSKIGF